MWWEGRDSVREGCAYAAIRKLKAPSGAERHRRSWRTSEPGRTSWGTSLNQNQHQLLRRCRLNRCRSSRLNRCHSSRCRLAMSRFRLSQSLRWSPSCRSRSQSLRWIPSCRCRLKTLLPSCCHHCRPVRHYHQMKSLPSCHRSRRYRCRSLPDGGEGEGEGAGAGVRRCCWCRLGQLPWRYP